MKLTYTPQAAPTRQRWEITVSFVEGDGDDYEEVTYHQYSEDEFVRQLQAVRKYEATEDASELEQLDMEVPLSTGMLPMTVDEIVRLRFIDTDGTRHDVVAEE